MRQDHRNALPTGVVVLGRGAAGKSTLARRLGARTGLPVIELDKHFWRPGLAETPREEWVDAQRKLIESPRWILDGDLGPYDVLDLRLGAADTVVVLDFSFWRCAWRAIRRSPERADFWRWTWRYRRASLPAALGAIATHAPEARVHILRNPRAANRFLARMVPGQRE